MFIVSLPRSGSTLLEQILSSHSLVEGTTELQDIPALANKVGAYPKDVLALDETARRELGEEYLKRASVQRRTDKPFFVDKLPNNWLYVPFIHLILPNAKIIDARRHPLSCCFSNFRQHFAHGQDFTYDLESLGRYYSDYVRLMSHVDAVLPGRVHRVIYERMVDDTEREIRSLLDYCGLEFEQQVLEFYKTERAIRTPSSEQVRRPIYREATEEWIPYERHLGPLKTALGPVLDAYPEPPAT
ncbi:MAG TPA: sulfotransferase [Sphingomicrobium sp.]|nr:sulfotransferase [Sphingomicrobium sp.]